MSRSSGKRSLAPIFQRKKKKKKPPWRVSPLDPKLVVDWEEAVSFLSQECAHFVLLCVTYCVFQSINKQDMSARALAQVASMAGALGG